MYLILIDFICLFGVCIVDVSSQEAVMGDFLKTWSETEYTNAGEVMQNVGKLQNTDSKNRYRHAGWQQGSGEEVIGGRSICQNKFGYELLNILSITPKLLQCSKNMLISPAFVVVVLSALGLSLVSSFTGYSLSPI